MYLVDIKDSDTRFPRICLYGRVSHSDVVKDVIDNVINGSNNIKTVIVDLSGAESICEECFFVLVDLAALHKIKFIGYSLFLEDELKRYGLIK
ncbi:hypothetical protein ASZ90_004814 [hydrocarbon metagenome]|uniref:STAS domain-containing protein n=1 Tax=hydrocarbon metagenome TaxID=938273 RepID=A0A0W8FWZ0_9ZZZZ